MGVIIKKHKRTQNETLREEVDCCHSGGEQFHIEMKIRDLFRANLRQGLGNRAFDERNQFHERYAGDRSVFQRIPVQIVHDR